MKKKTIISIGIAVTIIAVGLSVCILKRKQYDETKVNMNKAAYLFQPIFNTFLWAKECDDNHFSYDKEQIETVKRYYEKIVGNCEITEGLGFYDLTLVLAADRLINRDDDEFMEQINKYYDADTGLYRPFQYDTTKEEDRFIVELETTLNCQDKMSMAGESDFYNADHVLEDIVRDHVNDTDENMPNRIVQLIYRFWKKDKCENIDIKNKRIKELFQKIHTDVQAFYETNQELDIVALDDDEFFDVCDAIGIDVSMMRNKYNQWNFFDKKDLWYTWGETELGLSASVSASSIYYRKLIGGNESIKEATEFCDEFSRGLDKYCETILIPEMEKFMNEMEISK